MEKKLRILFPSALLAGICLPFLGITGLVHLIIAFFQIRNGESQAGARSIALAERWIVFSIYFGLSAITIFAMAVFFMGGNLIPAVGSFF